MEDLLFEKKYGGSLSKIPYSKVRSVCNFFDKKNLSTVLYQIRTYQLTLQMFTGHYGVSVGFPCCKETP